MKRILSFFTNPRQKYITTQLKGFAIMMIITWHCVTFYLKQIEYIGPDTLPWIFVSNGYIATWIFIIISGYLIGKGFFSKKYTFGFIGIFNFYITRFLKFAPLYFLVLVYLILSSSHSNPTPLPIIFRFATFSASGLSSYDWGYLWYVSILFQLYIISPLIYFILAKLQQRIPFYILSVLLGIYIIGSFSYIFITKELLTYQDFQDNFYTSIIICLCFYVLGFYLNVIIEKLRDIKKGSLSLAGKFIPALITFSAILMLAILYTLSSYLAYHFLLSFDDYIAAFIFIAPVLTSLAISLIITVFELIPLNGTLMIPCMILGWVGEYAYPLYLFHYLVIFELNDCPGGICKPNDLLQREGFVFFTSMTLIFFIYILKSCLFSLKKAHLKKR